MRYRASALSLVALLAAAPAEPQSIEDVAWTSEAGVSVSGNSLTKTGGAGWNAGAVSTRVLEAGGFVEFTATETNSNRSCGLSKGSAGEGESEIDFAIRLTSAAGVSVYENGTLRGSYGSYASGDRFRVEVGHRAVRYRKNGAVFYTSTVAAGFPLLVDSSMDTTGGTLTNVRVGDLGWVRDASVSVSGTTLTKTGSAGWNAGAISTKSIDYGDGYVDFEAVETNTDRRAGLSHADTNQDPADIDFGIDLEADETFGVVEAGVSRGSFGSYAAGDRFQVEVQGGTVRYYQNDVLFYTSTLSPQYPLVVDTALDQVGATLSDIRMASVLWSNVAGLSVSEGTLTNTGSTGWTSGASSTASVSAGDAYVEFTAVETTTARMAGLGNGDSDTDYSDIEFAISLGSTGTVSVYESGTLIGSHGSYVSGDRFRVEAVDGVVKYRKNGVVLYTSAAAPTYPLAADTSFDHTGGTLANVVFGRFVWTSDSGVYAWGSGLVKTATTGWGNAGAATAETIGSGDGFVEFVATEGNTSRMAGLSNGNTSNTYTDIDFSIYLMAGGNAQVYESGAAKGSTVPYAASDRFRVEVTSGVVRYRKNGAVFYTSAASPTYPLLVDSAFYTTGATLLDFALVSGEDMAKVSPVVLSPAPGTYTSQQALTMSTTTAGAQIRYTTDGTDPTGSSTLYSGALSLTTDTTFKAKAFADDLIPSDTAVAAYTFNYTGLAPPTMAPIGDTYTSSVAVSLSGPLGAAIRYTTNGTDPTGSSALYSAPITLNVTTTLKAKSFDGGSSSVTTTQTYTIVVATPTFTPGGGTYTAGQAITLNSATAGAVIHYTMSGLDPTSSDPSVASGGTIVAGNYTVKAKAFKTGCTASGVATATYEVTGSLTPGAVAAGYSHVLALQSDGTAWAWGYDYNGELGDGVGGPSEYRFVADRVVGLTGVTAIEAGYGTSIALRSDGTVWTFGSNSNGQLGDGTFTGTRATPYHVGISDVVAVAAGDSHMLALKADGTLWAWGLNSSGQIGDGTTTNRNTPAQVLTGVVGIAAGASHSLAVKSDGTIMAWGAGGQGRLGDGTTIDRYAPVQVDGLSSAIAVAAGWAHSLALRDDGTIWSWGANNGVLGDGSTLDRLTPQKVIGLSGVTAIVAGGSSNSVALKSDGTAWAWGIGNELGYGSTATSLVPVQVLGLSSVVRISSGHAITTDGSVWGWGSNTSYKVGDGTNIVRLLPVRVSDPAFSWKAGTPTYDPGAWNYTANQNVTIASLTPGATIHYTTSGAEPTESDPVVASGSTVLVDRNLTLRAKAWKTGRAPSNADAAAYTLTASMPTFTPAGGTFGSAPSVTMSTTTSGATIRYTTDGSEPTSSSTLYAAAVNVATTTALKAKAFKTDWTESATRTATYTMSFGPAAAPELSPAQATYVTSVEVTMSEPAGSTIRYTTNGTEPTTGSAVYSGPLTLTATTTVKAKSFHVDYSVSPTTTAIYTIEVAAPGLSPAGGTYSAGQEVTVSVATPGATIHYTLSGVDPTENDASIAAGSTLTLLQTQTVKAKAFKPGCTASAMTSATYTITGQLAQGRVFAGVSHSLVLEPDGSVWVMGYNNAGQLGDGTNTQREYPVNIAGLTTSTTLGGGGSHSLALRSDGTLQAAGANAKGQLGDGTTTARTTFTTTSSFGTVTAIAAGETHSLAVKSDGTAWAFGSNSDGQLGIGSADTSAHSTPAQVNTLSGVTSVAAGATHSVALKSDNTVWSFGDNAFGQIGDGTTTDRTSPVEVSGLSGVVAVAAGHDHTLALKSDGSLWAWGRNNYGGALGDGTTTNRSSPVQVVGIDGVVAVSAGSVHSLALKSDGTVWSWGNGNWHQLGNGSGGSTSPVQVPGLPGIVAIAAGATHNLVIDEEGGVWGWGWNSNGQMGDGTLEARPTPIRLSEASFLWKACTPTVTPAEGLYLTSQTATLSCKTPGVAIHYTTSGADPTVSDPSLSSGGTVPVDQTLTLKARAFKTGLASSNLMAALYTLKVQTPTFSLAGGTLNPYATPQNVTISTTTPSATIRYTTDGTEPNESSTLYSSAVLVDTSVTLKAKAFKTGWTASSTATVSYTMKVGTPQLSPGAGSYSSAQTVTVTTTTPGAVLRYTTSGLEPTESSAVVASGGTLLVDRSLTLKVSGSKTGGWTPSDTTNATYRITLGTVATPTFSLAGGPYGAAQSVSLATTTAGALIRYTLDGTEPGWTAPVYTGPLTIDWTTTVKAKAFLTDHTASATGSAAYTITSSAVAPAAYAPGPGSYTTYQRVVLTTSTSGAVVRYTTSGADPAETDPEAPVEGVLVDRSMVLKARAFKAGMDPSPIRRGGYQITGAAASGFSHAVLLKTDGTVWSFGTNATGQLGNGTTTSSDTPVQASGLTDVVAIATNTLPNGSSSAGHVLAVKRDGTLWAYGKNANGQLGDGTTTQRNSAVQVSGLTGVVAVAAGQSHSLAVKSDGTVWAFGYNLDGALGDGTETQRTTPVQVSGLTDIVAVAAGNQVSWALERDGTLWGWGDNVYGMVGDGTTTDRLTPVQLSSLTGVTALAGAGRRAVALKTDGGPTGSAWTWGYGEGYGLGDGTLENRSTPVQVLGGVTAIAAGYNQTLFLKREPAGPPSVWGTGRHYADRLDEGALGTTDDPVRVTTGPFVALAAGQTVSIALRRDTTILTWDTAAQPGRNDGLVLGLSGAADDPDGDGLSTAEEWALGSDPWNPDTNGDGIPDGIARATGMSLTNEDMDGDGLFNAAELALGTDPFRADTDEDGVGDATDAFPLDPTRSTAPAPNPSDTTPPVITLTEPTNATLISSVP